MPVKLSPAETGAAQKRDGYLVYCFRFDDMSIKTVGVFDSHEGVVKETDRLLKEHSYGPALTFGFCFIDDWLEKFGSFPVIEDVE